MLQDRFQKLTTLHRSNNINGVISLIDHFR